MQSPMPTMEDHSFDDMVARLTQEAVRMSDRFERCSFRVLFRNGLISSNVSRVQAEFAADASCERKAMQEQEQLRELYESFRSESEMPPPVPRPPVTDPHFLGPSSAEQQLPRPMWARDPSRVRRVLHQVKDIKSTVGISGYHCVIHIHAGELGFQHPAFDVSCFYLRDQNEFYYDLYDLMAPYSFVCKSRSGCLKRMRDTYYDLLPTFGPELFGATRFFLIQRPSNATRAKVPAGTWKHVLHVLDRVEGAKVNKNVLDKYMKILSQRAVECL